MFERIQRLPPYVLGVVTQLMMEARQRGEDVINLGMGNPDLATPPHIVQKLIEAAQKPVNHRYSLSKGIPKLRKAIVDWYQRRFQVSLDPLSETIATIGAKEGISHLVLGMCSPGDTVFVQAPTYPIHLYSVVIAGADLRSIHAETEEGFLHNLNESIKNTWPKPKLLICSFPSNPTTMTVDLPFLEKIVGFAREHDMKVIHDIAYADLVFDGYSAPSILQVKGAKEIAVEFFTLSKSYSMPGWRVGFCSGNKEMVAALAKIKSYMDYGTFQPIQIAATVALNGSQACVKEITQIYTVIEVGVDVPNASMMIIEQAERFGLSQLHQIRGRVGRGSHKSYCFLIAGWPRSEEAKARLNIICEHQDGFRISEEDLKIRGPGDFLGTRQTGLPDFRIVNLLRDQECLNVAKKEAEKWLSQIERHSAEEKERVWAWLKHRWKGRLNLAEVS